MVITIFRFSQDRFLVGLPLHFVLGQLFALTGFPTLSAHPVKWQWPFLQLSQFLIMLVL